MAFRRNVSLSETFSLHAPHTQRDPMVEAGVLGVDCLAWPLKGCAPLNDAKFHPSLGTNDSTTRLHISHL